MQCYFFVSDYFYYQYAYTLYSWTGKLVCRHKQKDTRSPKTLQCKCKSALCTQHPQPGKLRSLSHPCHIPPMGRWSLSTVVEKSCFDKLCVNCLIQCCSKVAGSHFCLPLKNAGICRHPPRWAAHRECGGAIGSCVDMVVIWEVESCDTSVGAEQQ